VQPQARSGAIATCLCTVPTTHRPTALVWQSLLVLATLVSEATGGWYSTRYCDLLYRVRLWQHTRRV
jgi:hypothetical protein